MIEIRRSQEILISEYHPADQMKCPIHFCLGQEAAPSALSNLLNKRDVMYSHHRSHGYFLAKKGSLTGMIAEFYGKKIGVNGGLAGSQELSSSEVNFYSGTILSGAFAMSAGSAFASKYTNQNYLTVGIIGDGGMEEGIIFETINIAAKKNLPVLFICENNNYSIFTPLKERTIKKDLHLKVKEFGIETIKITSNDVFEINEVFQYSINKIKNEIKPIFIEIETYRYCPHVGPEENSEYRSQEEMEYWQNNDCVEIAKKNMIKYGYTKEFLSNIYNEIDKLIYESIEESKKADFPNYNDALNCNFQNTYHEIIKNFAKEDSTEFELGQKESKLNPY